MKSKTTFEYLGNNEIKLEVQTDGVPKLTIKWPLDLLEKMLAAALQNAAQAQVGDDPEAQARWIDLQRQQPGQN